MISDELKYLTLSAGAFWILVYLVLVLAPLFVMLAGAEPAGGGFWWDLAIAFLYLMCLAILPLAACQSTPITPTA